MILSTGRLTTLAAGVTLFTVVSVAFFLVFDLSTALGSSSELPIVRIGEMEDQFSDEQTQQATGANTVSSPAGNVTQSSGAADGDTPTSVHGAAPSQDNRDAASDATTRKYVQEAVRVQKNDDRPTITTKPGTRNGVSGSPGQERR